jgi:hypothetical protein
MFHKYEKEEQNRNKFPGFVGLSGNDYGYDNRGVLPSIKKASGIKSTLGRNI